MKRIMEELYGQNKERKVVMGEGSAINEREENSSVTFRMIK
jgi:hypothetical protein